MMSMDQQATTTSTCWRVDAVLPGILKPRRALQRECVVTKESRSSAHRMCALPDRCNSKGGSGDDRQSEAPVGAVKSGNADGAKGRRFGMADQGDMTRHRADCVHDN